MLINTDGAKYWRFDYRFNGKRKTLAFGKYPDITLGEACNQWQEARTQIQHGIDPSENKKAQKAARKESVPDHSGKKAKEKNIRTCILFATMD